MTYWRSLPAEIRWIIQNLVVEDYNFKSGQYVCAGYASVCREWQAIFEQRNFRRLILDQELISDFEQYMGARHRQEYLMHLFLRVRLDEYDCTVCQLKEDQETIRSNNDIISRAVWSLLIILSWWNKPLDHRPGHRQVLMLELGVYSPSDCQHTFRDFHLEQSYPYEEPKDLEAHWEAYKQRVDRLGLRNLDDPFHGWVNGHREPLSLGSKQRLTGKFTINPNPPEFSVSSQAFPKVEIITSLLIRRHFYRKIAVISLRKLIREAFTCLRSLRYEGWHGVTPQQQACFEKGYHKLISSDLPSTLKSLCIFEDFNMILHPERPAKRPNSSLGKALSKSSHLLENLSAAFLIDAKDFFAPFWPAQQQNSNITPWENLRRLALTSRLLHPKIGRRKINKLLIAAGRAAAFMPKLEVMEI